MGWDWIGLDVPGSYFGFSSCLRFFQIFIFGWFWNPGVCLGFSLLVELSFWGWFWWNLGVCYGLFWWYLRFGWLWNPWIFVLRECFWIDLKFWVIFKSRNCSFVHPKSSNCFCACGAQGAPNLQESEKFDPDPDSFVRGADRHRHCCVKGREGGKSRRSNARALYVAAPMGDIFAFFFFLGFLPSGKFPLVLIFQILFPNSFVSC